MDISSFQLLSLHFIDEHLWVTATEQGQEFKTETLQSPT